MVGWLPPNPQRRLKFLAPGAKRTARHEDVASTLGFLQTFSAKLQLTTKSGSRGVSRRRGGGPFSTSMSTPTLGFRARALKAVPVFRDCSPRRRSSHALSMSCSSTTAPVSRGTSRTRFASCSG
jgi:hypothetical protein